MIATPHHPYLARASRGWPADLARLLPLLAVALATAALVWPAFAHALEVWSTVSEFSFGYFIPPVSLGLVWWHRQALRRAIGPGAPAGLPIVLGALAVYLVAQRVGINALAGLAVIPLLWGMVVYLWGWGAWRVLAFPIGYLAFGLGLYRGLLGSVGFAMQGVTATGAALFGRALGLPVVQDGLVLRVGGYSFIVAEACSGMSSLVSLLALAAVWTHFVQASLAARLTVLLSVLPLVLLANITRVALVLQVAAWFGQDAALGYYEGASNLVLFGLALAGLVIVSRMVGCRLPSHAR